MILYSAQTPVGVCLTVDLPGDLTVTEDSQV